MFPNFGAAFHAAPNFTPNTNPYSHANNFHQPQTPVQQPLNRYDPDAKITRLYDHRTVDTHVELRPGDVVEVEGPGGQRQLEYATYNQTLRPLNQSVLGHVPPEIRDHVNRVGGPSYFAHELHNQLPTSQLYSQFNSQNFHGPNKPLI